MLRGLILAAALALAPFPVFAQVSSLSGPVASIADVLQYSQPSSGATVTCTPATSLLVIDNGSLLATLTVTLTPSPMDGQRIVITSGSGVTLLTINGGTIKGLITSLSANGYARFAYSASAGAWFRTG